MFSINMVREWPTKKAGGHGKLTREQRERLQAQLDQQIETHQQPGKPAGSISAQPAKPISWIDVVV